MLVPDKSEIVKRFADMAAERGYTAALEGTELDVESPLGPVTVDVSDEFTRIVLNGEMDGTFHNSNFNKDNEGKSRLRFDSARFWAMKLNPARRGPTDWAK